MALEPGPVGFVHCLNREEPRTALDEEVTDQTLERGALLRRWPASHIDML